MLINGRMNKVFRFDDLNSLISFEEWIKRNLGLYDEDKSVPFSHIKIFLEHIKNKVKEQRVFEKREWFEQIDQLIERIEEK